MALSSEVQLAYLVEVLCPQIKDIGITRLGIHPSPWEKVVKKRKRNTLRVGTIHLVPPKQVKTESFGVLFAGQA